MSRPRSKPQRDEEHELTIHGLAYGGNGVGRLTSDDGGGGMAVFVPRSAPGDRLRVRIDRVRRRHAEASIVEVLEPGPGRIDPPCPHYQEGCGGCSWQHLDYAAQLEGKAQEVRDSLERIGGLADPPMVPIVRMDEPWYYRNKMEFSFNARDGLGLHLAGDWRRLVPVTECRLQSQLAMRVLEHARSFAAEHELSYWDPVDKSGFLREMVVRHAVGSGERMVGLVTAPGPFPLAQAFADGVAALDDSIVSVVHAVRDEEQGGSPIVSVEAIRGEPTITERVGGLSFRLGLQTFFQTNTAQAARMAEIVREHVRTALEARPASDGLTRILDVFCGVGFFTLLLADLADEVLGVEIVEPSIVAARDNAELNGIDNATFYSGDARRTLPEIINTHGAPHVVVLDPPRSGAGGKVMRRIARSAPDRIVYVSCNPTTLARDLTELEPFGYRVREVRPLDLFPQTYHVESIVAVDRISEEDAR